MARVFFLPIFQTKNCLSLYQYIFLAHANSCRVGKTDWQGTGDWGRIKISDLQLLKASKTQAKIAVNRRPTAADTIHLSRK